MDPVRIAEIAHEANRAYCRSIGDNSQLEWDAAPEWQRQSAIDGVWFHFRNPHAHASDSHREWFEKKLRDGWAYGPVKDPINKRHPCMVPFGELPFDQQVKDHIFRSVVRGCLQARI
jgi:hypothetical protein